MAEISLKIEKTWDDQNLDHEPIEITLKKDETDDYLLIDISAPFFNSPQKPEKPIGEFFNLWDYEVVEVFFLAESGCYLELEFGPHGHYIGLLLKGPGKTVIKEGLKFEFDSNISGQTWTGRAKIPETYFPKNVTKINAYAIHGEKDARQYEALYPVPHSKYPHADFHRLDYFRPVDLKPILGTIFQSPDQ